jgi:hypothetical protein
MSKDKIKKKLVLKKTEVNQLIFKTCEWDHESEIIL